MLTTDIIFNDKIGESPIYNGQLLVDIANYISTKGFRELWVSNTKGKPTLSESFPDNLFAKVLIVDENHTEQYAIEWCNENTIRVVLVYWPSGRSKLLSPLSFRDNQPYEGRQYLLNKADCYRLAVEYYEREYQKFLTEYLADDSWLRAQMNPRTYNLMLRKYAENGFEKVSSIQKGDALLINTVGDVGDPNHIAIYLGDDSILHHIPNKLSCVQQYTSFWKSRTSAILRLKDLL